MRSSFLSSGANGQPAAAGAAERKTESAASPFAPESQERNTCSKKSISTFEDLTEKECEKDAPKKAEESARKRPFSFAGEPKPPLQPGDGKILLLPADRVLPNPAQPRTSFADDALLRLADSIRQYGMLQPLTGRRLGEDWELIAGERRLRAAKLCGLKQVPCLVIAADGQRSAELAIIENLQREDLNLFEQASAIAALMDPTLAASNSASSEKKYIGDGSNYPVKYSY